MGMEKLRKKFPDGILRTEHPFYMADAIRQIPDCLEACISSENIEKIKIGIGAFTPDRIFTIGCGTSFNSAEAVAYVLQNLLKIPAIAYDAYDFELDTPPGVNHQAMVIGISESGQSITTCLSLEKSKEAGAFTVGISANPESRLSHSVDLSLVDPFLREIPLGKTRTFLSSILLGISAGIQSGEENRAKLIQTEIRETITMLRENNPEFEVDAKKIANDLPPSQLRYIVTGYGSQKANADEIALKIMEVLGEGATSFGLEEFTHGPSACFKNDLVVMLLQTDERTLAKAIRIAQGIVFSSPHLIVITDNKDAGWPERANIIELPKTPNPTIFGQFTAAVAAQNLIYAIALRKNLNPDVNLEDKHPELGEIYAFFFPPETH
jgi:glucosamine 6-phosphate synthetase-like amidotransferase/phosphosugar isomerase protein